MVFGLFGFMVDLLPGLKQNLYNRLFWKYGHFGFMVNFCLVPLDTKNKPYFSSYQHPWKVPNFCTNKQILMGLPSVFSDKNQ